MKKKPESFPLYYRVFPSVLGDIGVIWVKKDGPSIIHIILPKREVGTLTLIDERYPEASEDSDKKIDEMCEKMVRYLVGEPVRFSLTFLDIDRCYDLQKKVLLKAAEIPRGRVISYGGLAEKISAPCASRAVGTALARNPFPLILPCHRVVKASGYPGQYGGGADTKKRLLAMEGVLFNDGGKIEDRFFW
ncbi:MAG: methylated-DNA--[protein]-cysteine S-methyltransferase [Deltaproteobacteria bacterium]|nr:methylated-DNA--[protein]-cysteine S-methyltransferase [Deltaproteobacteria bacterium]MBN2845188.1 methylated-DNA--[protein]-cysteine S-methyltransferase [Deltaproteobacteria bacterium]